MWAFKSLWDKGLVYEGFRVLAYCWRCETPLSNTETRMDDVYRARQDPAVTVGFQLASGPAKPARGCWSGPPRRGRCRPTSRSRSAPTWSTSWCEHRRAGPADAGRVPGLGVPRPRAGGGPGGAIRRSAPAGRDLVGRRLHPAVRLLRRSTPNAFQVLSADYVTTDDGTGLVHMAPAFGEDDAAGRRTPYGIERPWCPSTVHRSLHRGCPPYAGRARLRGQQTAIIADLKRPRRPTRARCWHAAAPAGDLRRTRTRTAGAATRR